MVGRFLGTNRSAFRGEGASGFSKQRENGIPDGRNEKNGDSKDHEGDSVGDFKIFFWITYWKMAREFRFLIHSDLWETLIPTEFALTLS